VAEQQSQVQWFVDNGASVIVINDLAAGQLGEQLAAAKAAGIYIIAYVHPLNGTDDVDLYVSHDQVMIGTLQAQALIEGLRARGDGPYSVELIAGDELSTAARERFSGAMAVLQPLIDDGTIVIPSGEVAFEQAATDGWWVEPARIRLENILSAHYTDKRLDGVLAVNDTLARVALSVAESAGRPSPVIVGADSDFASVRLIIDGIQYATVDQDTQTLVNAIIDIIRGLQAGIPPAATGMTNNGVFDVPTVLLDPVLVTKENVCSTFGEHSYAGRAADQYCP
jgi:putative multiple sugar transport system substrate-binding protein